MNCAHCGKPASSHELEWGFGMPDAIFTLSKESRTERAVIDSDLCMLDRSRFFVRGVLYLPIHDAQRAFGIGFWSETDKKTFDWYLTHYEADLFNEPPGSGYLANAFERKGYSKTLGVPVLINWGRERVRPTFKVVAPEHELYAEQTRGITLERAHELLSLPS
jgi:hypothetical protein